jgi:hypothetical protein
MNAQLQILNLLSLNGSWAIRAVFDDSIRCYLQGQNFNLPLIEKVIEQSSWEYCQRYLTKLSPLTGVTSSLSNDVTKPIKPIINLATLASYYEPLSKAQIWRERLELHYGASGEKLYPAILALRQQEPQLTNDQSIDWLSWSFEKLPTLLGFSGNIDRIKYLPDPIAALCWKRWYLANDSQTILWTDTGITPETSSSIVLVYRCLHESTHLHHLSAFPNAGSLIDPRWLLTMEAVAMATEYLFWESIKDKSEQDYPFMVDVHAIEGQLLVGLYERALRIDFDLMVHESGMAVNEWIEWAVGKTYFPASFFDFANEFYGVAGFAAGYTLGMECFLAANTEVRQQLIKGEFMIDSLINQQIQNDAKLY